MLELKIYERHVHRERHLCMCEWEDKGMSTWWHPSQLQQPSPTSAPMSALLYVWTMLVACCSHLLAACAARRAAGSRPRMLSSCRPALLSKLFLLAFSLHSTTRLAPHAARPAPSRQTPRLRRLKPSAHSSSTRVACKATTVNCCGCHRCSSYEWLLLVTQPDARSRTHSGSTSKYVQHVSMRTTDCQMPKKGSKTQNKIEKDKACLAFDRQRAKLIDSSKCN